MHASSIPRIHNLNTFYPSSVLTRILILTLIVILNLILILSSHLGSCQGQVPELREVGSLSVRLVPG